MRHPRFSANNKFSKLRLSFLVEFDFNSMSTYLELFYSEWLIKYIVHSYLHFFFLQWFNFFLLLHTVLPNTNFKIYLTIDGISTKTIMSNSRPKLLWHRLKWRNSKIYRRNKAYNTQHVMLFVVKFFMLRFSSCRIRGVDYNGTDKSGEIRRFIREIRLQNSPDLVIFTVNFVYWYYGFM